MTPVRRVRPAPESVMHDRFAHAGGVADAVLYEGYLLYPYRRSSAKNRVRWQFGVLAPPGWIGAQRIPDPGLAGSAESWFQQVECLAEAPPDAMITVRVRCLHVRHRQPYDAAGQPVDSAANSLDFGLNFDDASAFEFDVRFELRTLLAGAQQMPFVLPAEHTVEHAPDGSGAAEQSPHAAPQTVRAAEPTAPAMERTAHEVHGRVVANAQQAAAPFPLLRLQLRVENTTDLDDPHATREEALRHSLVAAHLLIGLDRGRFVSLLDPPAWAAEAAAACTNLHVFPVLAGADDGSDAMLCSPVILYDHPKIAPESPGDLHDATEIDEILTLRTLTLSDAEKAEARATDPRAAAIVDSVDAMPPEILARLHGAMRDLRPAHPPAAPDDELPWWDPRAEAAVRPESDSVLVAGHRVRRGSLVRLHPRGRGTDAHDMFLAGRTATVHAVLRDVDGSTRVAVTVDGDPAADLHEWYGRFFHFTPDEIEPAGVNT